MRSMKRMGLIAVLAASMLALPACDLSSVGSYGTLSGASDQASAEAAGFYTQLARYRYNATALMRQKKITVDEARQALDASDALRRLLDRAVSARNIGQVRQIGGQINDKLDYLELKR
jgi:hypothetical protein